jgi:hypothetical protein
MSLTNHGTDWGRIPPIRVSVSTADPDPCTQGSHFGNGALVLRLFPLLCCFCFCFSIQFVRPGSRRPFFNSRLDNWLCSISVIHSFYPHSTRGGIAETRILDHSRWNFGPSLSLGAISVLLLQSSPNTASRHPGILEYCQNARACAPQP